MVVASPIKDLEMVVVVGPKVGKVTLVKLQKTPSSMFDMDKVLNTRVQEGS